MKKLIKVEKLTDRKYINLFEAIYFEDGLTKKYEIASRKKEPDIISKSKKVDAVRIIPYFYKDNEMYVALIKEFRYAINDYVYGVPAGLCDGCEKPELSAIRELGEEIGAKVIKIKETEPASYSSVGMSDESLICYEAEVELTGMQTLDESEDIQIVQIKLSELSRYLNNEKFDLQSRLQLRAFLYKQRQREIMKNIKNKRLVIVKKNKKIGAFVGKFYPPHVGHLYAINSALEKCDEVYVIISKNETRSDEIEKQSGFKKLDAQRIKAWFEEYYKNDKRVKVRVFDESGLKPYPEDLDIWAFRFKQEFPFINVKIADETYKEYNKKFFPECEFLPVDRDKVHIHSSEIRSNYEKYKNYCIPTMDQDILKGEKNE